MSLEQILALLEGYLSDILIFCWFQHILQGRATLNFVTRWEDVRDGRGA